MKQMKTVTERHSYSDVAFGRVDPEDFISWLSSWCDTLNAIHRTKMTISIQSDSSSIVVVFTIIREETDEEYQQRIERENQLVNEKKNKQLKRLQKMAVKLGYTLREETET